MRLREATTPDSPPSEDDLVEDRGPHEAMEPGRVPVQPASPPAEWVERARTRLLEQLSALGKTPPGSDDEAMAAERTGTDRAALEETRRGEHLGRYLVLSKLGVGAMGVVLAAYDPELDRKVALKLIRSRATAGDQAAARLRREARSLAKLDHRNVVTVFDVGLHDDRLYLAMELVEGRTLAQWLHAVEPPRPWREIARVMLGAGRGLGAAHRAGLVHRDFKPHNIMVGADDLPRVTDFGLARVQDAPTPSVETSDWQDAPTMADDPLTESGMLVGTPAYMAPEQLRGGAADARSDQFGYCVTFYEALYGERPFRGRSVADLLAAIEEGATRAPPPASAVPTWLRKLVLRGLAPQPDDRWPDMDALLAELERGLASRRPWWGLGGLAGLVAAITFASASSPGPRPCEGAADHLVGVWDDTRKQETREAILATALPHAASTWDRVEAALDDHAERWITTHTEVCTATSVREEQSPAVMDLRMECLHDRLAELREVVDLLAHATEGRVQRGMEMVSDLSRLDRCNDVATLRAAVPPPEDPTVAAAVEEARQLLRRAAVLDTAGELPAALELAKQAMTRARDLDYPPLLAEAAYRRGTIVDDLGRRSDSESDFEQAYLLALESDHGELEAKAAASWISKIAADEGRHEIALALGKVALARARSRGDRSGEAYLLHSLGGILRAHNRTDEALAHYREVLEIHQSTLGPEHPQVAQALDSLGQTLARRGELREALEHQLRALSVYERTLGPQHAVVAQALSNVANTQSQLSMLGDAQRNAERALAIADVALSPRHPHLAAMHVNLGNVLSQRGDLDGGLLHYQRALSIQEATLPPGHRAFGISLNNIGSTLLKLGRRTEALDYLHRAAEQFEASLGPEHPFLAWPLGRIGVTLRTQGKVDEALPFLRRALAIREQALGAEHIDVVDALTDLGAALHAKGELDEAWSLLQRALAISEQALGEGDPSSVDAHMELADLALSRGDPETARVHASRALEICESTDTHPRALAYTRFVLARALWAGGDDHLRARTLAQRARDQYASFGPGEAETLAAIEAWIEAHPVK